MQVHLRDIRRARGQTLQAVADALGGTIALSSLACLETEVYAPRLWQLEALATVYDCHPFDLVSFPDYPPARRCACGRHRQAVPGQEVE